MERSTKDDVYIMTMYKEMANKLNYKDPFTKKGLSMEKRIQLRKKRKKN